MSLLLLFLYTGYKAQEIQPPVGLKYIKLKLPATKLWAPIPFLFAFTLFIDIFIFFFPQGVEAKWGRNQRLFIPALPPAPPPLFQHVIVPAWPKFVDCLKDKQAIYAEL